MESEYEIFWTEESLRNLDDIIEYLNLTWTEREVASFKLKLFKQLEIISKNPYLFPASQNNLDLRKAVLSKQTTILYQIEKRHIFIIYLFDTRQDPGRIK